MSFDKNNLERLRQLGRKLPKKLPTSNPNSNSSSKDSKPKKGSCINEEKTLDDLFRESIETSIDGTFSPELISKIKQIEREKKETRNEKINQESENINSTIRNKRIKSNQNQKLKHQEELYTSFQRLLLEEEDL